MQGCAPRVVQRMSSRGASKSAGSRSVARRRPNGGGVGAGGSGACGESSASGEENYWCEVDDDWVGRFDMENLLDDTFGYQEDSDASDQDDDVDEEHLDTIPCAYILLYDRVI